MLPVSSFSLVFVVFVTLITYNRCSVLRYDDLPGVHWAVIVAGSNGWDNYRHQADACHAYQILLRHGLPKERIVTMMYDDIAQNTQNPTPGIIINHPQGKDVYQGVVIDYKGEDVTPANFLAVLSGDAASLKGVGSGKVLKSGPNDRVFVNFVDHGATGLVAFPSDELYARDLMDTLLKMHNQKKFKEMVLYIEACESGSMFENLLPNNISIWASSASNSEESSYACYFDDLRSTYLGDVYSVNWMEDSDKKNLNSETVLQQFTVVREETNTSHVMQWGDKTVAKDHVGDFQSGSSGFHPDPIIVPKVPFDAVPSEHVPLAILQRRLMSVNDFTEEENIREQITSLLQLNQQVDDTVKMIVHLATRESSQAERVLTKKYQLTEWDCYEPAVELFDEKCFDISQVDQARHRLRILANLCQERIAATTILKAIAEACSVHA